MSSASPAFTRWSSTVAWPLHRSATSRRAMNKVPTALGQAYSDSVPMLVLSSVHARNHLGAGNAGSGRLHELRSQQALVAGLTAFSHTLMQPGDLPVALARAFAVFD